MSVFFMVLGYKTKNPGSFDPRVLVENIQKLDLLGPSTITILDRAGID